MKSKSRPGLVGVNIGDGVCDTGVIVFWNVAIRDEIKVQVCSAEAVESSELVGAGKAGSSLMSSSLPKVVNS